MDKTLTILTPQLALYLQEIPLFIGTMSEVLLNEEFESVPMDRRCGFNSPTPEQWQPNHERAQYCPLEQEPEQDTVVKRLELERLGKLWKELDEQ